MTHNVHTAVRNYQLQPYQIAQER